MPLPSKGASPVRAYPISKSITRVYLLGPMRAMDRAGGDNILPSSKKTQAVLAILCLAQGDRLLRSTVAGRIWDRSTEKQARDSLRHALNELAGAGSWRLETDHETIRLDATDCWIDAFESPAQSDLLLAELYGISTSFDHWLLEERVRFENRWQASLEEEFKGLVARHAAPDERAASARKLLNFVTTHESALRALMMAFFEMGDRALAIREYERFCLLLQGRHDLTPSEETVALYEAIRRGGLPVAASAAKGPEHEIPKVGKPAVPLDDLLKASYAGDGPRFGPSVAVLPLENLSSDPTHGYVAEGLVEDLVEGLARVPGLFIVSRLSAAAFRHQNRLPQEIGAALGVEYILSGGIRIIADQLRLTVELADTRTGAALWRNRYDENVLDLLEMQSRLAEGVVQSVAPNIHFAEVKRVKRKRPGDYDAYDLFLRALQNMHNPSREVFETAGPLFAAAVEREPLYATALASLAHWHVLRVGQGWSPDPLQDTAEAENYAQRAVDSDSLDPMALAIQGHIAGYLHRDFGLARARFETALRINPNNGRAWLWSSYAHAWVGEGPPAVANIKQAMALSPYDPLVCAYSGAASVAYLADEQYTRAIEFALRCIGENRSYTTAYKALILGLALSDRAREAQTPVHQLLLLEPNFTVEKFRLRSPAGAGEIGDRFCGALARAGVPLSD
jgi:TolB-like protein/DNA-binding SARP family transcriptional activator